MPPGHPAVKKLSDPPRIVAAMPYETGPDVQYRLDLVGGGPGIVERLLATQCPTCGADWTKPGGYRVGHSGIREFLCWTCMCYHRAVEVDAAGKRVRPGSRRRRRA